MYQIQNIANILAHLVTEIAFTFPVCYINTISLFYKGNVIAKIDWIAEDENKIVIHNTLPAYITKYDEGTEYSDVEIIAIGMHGELLKIFSPVWRIVKPMAA